MFCTSQNGKLVILNVFKFVKTFYVNQRLKNNTNFDFIRRIEIKYNY